MMNQEETNEFAKALAARLGSDEPMEAVVEATCARIEEIPPELFQGWAKEMVSARPREDGAYRGRVQAWNTSLARRDMFVKAVGAYHAWRLAQEADAAAKIGTRDEISEIPAAIKDVVDHVRGGDFHGAVAALRAGNERFLSPKASQATQQAWVDALHAMVPEENEAFEEVAQKTQTNDRRNREWLDLLRDAATLDEQTFLVRHGRRSGDGWVLVGRAAQVKEV